MSHGDLALEWMPRCFRNVRARPSIRRRTVQVRKEHGGVTALIDETCARGPLPLDLTAFERGTRLVRTVRAHRSFHGFVHYDQRGAAYGWSAGTDGRSRTRTTSCTIRASPPGRSLARRGENTALARAAAATKALTEGALTPSASLEAGGSDRFPWLMAMFPSLRL